MLSGISVVLYLSPSCEIGTSLYTHTVVLIEFISPDTVFVAVYLQQGKCCKSLVI